MSKAINRDLPPFEETAYHEAAHAVMSLMKGIYVHSVEIYDSVTNGLAGCCIISQSENLKGYVSAMLAGPAMDSIHKSEPMHVSYFSVGSRDFEMAFEACQAVLAPRPPQEIRGLVPSELSDIRGMAQDIYDGWRPEGIHGQAKRKLTMYLKRYAESLNFIQEYVHSEASIVRNEICDSEIGSVFIPAVAKSLLSERKLTQKDLIKICLSASNSSACLFS
jgi:hypothetical protein